MPITLGVIGISLCLAIGAFAQGKAPVARTPDGQPLLDYECYAFALDDAPIVVPK